MNSFGGAFTNVNQGRMLIEKYQSHVLNASEIVEYSTIVKNLYPTAAIMNEPFIGFKVLCKDLNANNPDSNTRMMYLDKNIGQVMYSKGTIVRATAYNEMPDGLWVITLPVPQSQVVTAFNNLMDVLNTFEQCAGIIKVGTVEINVSGKCHTAMTETCMARLVIPKRFEQYVHVPENSPYKYGWIVRINDNFACLRTRWTIQSRDQMCDPANPIHWEDVIVLCQMMSSIYH